MPNIETLNTSRDLMARAGDSMFQPQAVSNLHGWGQILETPGPEPFIEGWSGDLRPLNLLDTPQPEMFAYQTPLNSKGERLINSFYREDSPPSTRQGWFQNRKDNPSLVLTYPRRPGGSPISGTFFHEAGHAMDAAGDFSPEFKEALLRRINELEPGIISSKAEPTEWWEQATNLREAVPELSGVVDFLQHPHFKNADVNPTIKYYKNSTPEEALQKIREKEAVAEFHRQLQDQRMKNPGTTQELLGIHPTGYPSSFEEY